MSDYVRPALAKQTFYDAAGAVINYGDRWPGRIPPEDSYSVDSNRERFAPLHTIADALIDHLVENYNVLITEDLAVADDLMRPHDDVSRAVRLTPSNPDGAPLTFVYTSFPGLILHAGLLHDFPFPTCGCDACDETAEGLAGDLENTVLAVAAGRFSESVSPGSSLPLSLEVAYELGARNGTFWARGGRGESAESERIRSAEARLRGQPDGWQPWRRRTEDP